MPEPDENCIFFFFNDTATTEIYTLSLHDALPILLWPKVRWKSRIDAQGKSSWWIKPKRSTPLKTYGKDRKSTRLNSSHLVISYAVFCLKKKKESPHCFDGLIECMR